jgi:hypothetical protein
MVWFEILDSPIFVLLDVGFSILSHEDVKSVLRRDCGLLL